MNTSTLSEKQQRELEKIRAEITQLEVREGEIDKRDPADWKSKDKLVKQKKALEDKESDILKKEEDYKKRLEVTRQTAVSDVEKDKVFEIPAYSINLPGGGGQLEQLLRAYCVNLSNLGNPFKDSYTDSQQKELVESMTGKGWINDNGTGNTPYTFSWFKKQWQYFSDYADNYVVYETPEKINDLNDVFVDRREVLRGVILGLKNKDIAAYIKKIKGETGYNKEDRAQEYLYNNNRKLKALVPYPVQSHILSSERVGKESYFLSSDFMHFFSSIFPEGTRDTSFLLNRGNSSIDYTIESNSSSWVKSAKFDNLAFFRWYEQGANSKLNKDHKESAWGRAMSTLVIDYDNKSGVQIKSEPIKLRVGSGWKGVVDSFHQVFTPSVQKKYIFLRFLRSIPSGENIYIGGSSSVRNPSKDSDYLTARKLISAAFSVGEVEIESVDEIRKEIAKKQQEIIEFDAKAPLKDNDYNKMIIEKTRIIRRLAELRKKEEELTGTDEAEMCRVVLQAAKRINQDSPTSMDDFNMLDDTLDYSFYSRFLKTVKTRLISEGKLDGDSDKNWKFEEGTEVKNEGNDRTLKHRKEFREARNKRKKILDAVRDAASRIGVVLQSAKGDQVKWIEKWVKDKNNAQAAQQLLKDLNELENNKVKLSETQKEIRDTIKKSDLIPKDLRGFLTYLWTKNKQTTLDQKVLSAFSGYRWGAIKFNEGSHFSRLATHPSDITTVDIKDRTGSNKKLYELIKDKIDQGDISYDIIGPMLEYRFREFLKKSSSDREKDYKKEEMLRLLNEAETACSLSLSDITEGSKSAQDLKDELVKGIGKAKGEALGLNYERTSELNVIMKWEKYNAEEIKEIVDKLKEEGKKEFIENNEPEKVHQEAINRQMENYGVKTEADVTKTKATDKEGMANLEKLEKAIEKAEEKGAATEEQKKIRAAIVAHREASKPKETKTDDKEKDKDTNDKGKDKDSDKSQEKGKTEDGQGEQVLPWYKKWGGALIWGPIAAIILIGVGVWYFAFRKPEGAELEEGETPDEGKVTE